MSEKIVNIEIDYEEGYKNNNVEKIVVGDEREGQNVEKILVTSAGILISQRIEGETYSNIEIIPYHTIKTASYVLNDDDFGVKVEEMKF